MARAAIRRRFLFVGNRGVHYRRTGKGPPIVLIHQSPQSSAGVVPLMQRLAPHATVFAFDTPGCGDSDALPKRHPRIPDYARALAETLDVLGLDKVTLFGTKTGACIALEYARAFPHRVQGVVFDSLPVFTKAEVADMTRVVRTADGDDAHYLMPFRPVWDGSHLISTWSHVRDHVFWFPWYRREARARRQIDMPSPEAMHAGVLDNFRAGDDLRIVVEAAFRYETLRAVKALRVPATFVSREEDMLFHCLAMLPRLRRHQVIRPLGRDMGAYYAAVTAGLRGYAKGLTAAESAVKPPPRRTTRFFADRAGDRQLLFRHREGTGTDVTPLVLLHDAPGSSRQLEPLIEVLAGARPLLAPDLPGSGDSSALPRQPVVADFAKELRSTLVDIGGGRVDLYGEGTGATLALALAVLWPRGVRRLVLDGLLLPNAAARRTLAARMTPDITPSWDGAHLYRTWLMMRDRHIYWPWYERRREAIRRVDLTQSPAALHDRVFEVLTAWSTYHQPVQAALRHDAARDLPGLKMPVLIMATEGDPAEADVARAARMAPDSRVAEVAARHHEKAAAIRAFLTARSLAAR